MAIIASNKRRTGEKRSEEFKANRRKYWRNQYGCSENLKD